jgi:catalase
MLLKLRHKHRLTISTRPISLLETLGAFVPPVFFVVLLVTSAAKGFADDRLAPEEKPLPVAAVDAFNALSGGPHAGFRANHAKGLLTSGTFTPAKRAVDLSEALHFSASVPVLVRFSNPTGVPNLPDADPNASPHGMAIRFQLPDGSSTDMVCISANGFPVATPEDFVTMLQAVARSGADVAKPTPIEQFLGSHPAALKFVTTPRPAPESFATLAFFGVNAFKFTNGAGRSRFARYQILPVAGEHSLSDADAAKAKPNYLMDELPQRIAKSPVKFRLVAQLANDGDSTSDPTAVWPDDREQLELGIISVAATSAEQVAAQKALLFNPLTLPKGIEPSDDPVLLFRPAAYAVSYGQRAQ